MGRTEDIDRWVEAGIIDSATAEAIVSFEADRTGSGRIGRGIEAVAYLGAVLVIVALGLLIGEFWDRMEPWGQFTLAAIVTLILVGVGFVLGRSDEPAVNRAQTFAWLLAVATLALTGYVAVSEIIAIDESATFLIVSLAALAGAIALWWLRKSVLQMVAMGITAASSVVAGISLIETAPDFAFGLSLAGLGLIWLLLTWGGMFQPSQTSYALSGIAMLLIAFPEGAAMPWPLLGLGVGLFLMAASVRLNQGVLLGLGVAGLFIYIPMTIFELFGESLGVPVALLVTGVVLLGVVVATVRLRHATEQ